MTGFNPIVNVAIVLAAALVGGMVAHRLRQPVILGYLLVGVSVGSYCYVSRPSVCGDYGETCFKD